MIDRDRNSLFAERSWTAGDGVSLYFREYQGALGVAKLPVVCLHGLTRNSKDFEEIAVAIAETGRRVIVPDIRGRGRSGYDPDPLRYLPTIYANDVQGLLQAVGIERAVFLGTSMGGIITTVLAARRRRMVAAAILNDVGPEANPEGLARIAEYAGIPVKVSSWGDAAVYVSSTNKIAFPNADESLWARFAERVFREEGGHFRLDYDPQIRQPIALGKLKPRPRLSWFLFRLLAWHRPILLLRGEHSDILSREIVLQMKKLARHLKVVEVPGVGHAPLLDEPSAEEAVLRFLDTIE